MASVIPKEVKKEVVDGWVAETTWKVALFTNASNCASQSLYSGCDNEVTGTGYTVGGATLTGRVAAYVETSNVNIDATDTAWSTSSFTARYAVVYNTANSKIRAIFDFTQDYQVTSGTFTIQWNTAGLIKIS